MHGLLSLILQRHGLNFLLSLSVYYDLALLSLTLSVLSSLLLECSQVNHFASGNPLRPSPLLFFIGNDYLMLFWRRRLICEWNTCVLRRLGCRSLVVLNNSPVDSNGLSSIHSKVLCILCGLNRSVVHRLGISSCNRLHFQGFKINHHPAVFLGPFFCRSVISLSSNTWLGSLQPLLRLVFLHWVVRHNLLRLHPAGFRLLLVGKVLLLIHILHLR